VTDRTSGEAALAPHGDAARARSAPPGKRRSWRTLAIYLAPPVVLLIAALVLPSFLLSTSRPFRGAGFGPAAWPQFMLALVAICCVIWAFQTAIAWWRGRLGPSAAATPAAEPYSYFKALSGLLLILAYGWSLPLIGFPVATALFVALWCILGGIRNPFVVLPISLIGTAVLLWVFMGLALMPLSRGRGIFDGISIAVLRALGIY
jgi:putative tricarboxylic transport membrane protein